MKDETTDTRIRRLAQALTTATAPLVKLFEYADDLEKLVADEDLTAAACVAAVIRCEALEAKAQLDLSLDAVREAATQLAVAS